VIRDSAHQPALFLIQDGISPDEELVLTSTPGTLMIPFFIRYSIPETKSLSSICWSAHHAALFLIHLGMVCDAISSINGS